VIVIKLIVIYDLAAREVDCRGLLWCPIVIADDVGCGANCDADCDADSALRVMD
jgi:hypothetical protein